MLKSSLKVLNKYSTDMDSRLQLTPSRPQLVSDSDSAVTERLPQFDRLSNYSKVSFKSRTPNRSAQDLKFSHLI